MSLSHLCLLAKGVCGLHRSDAVFRSLNVTEFVLSESDPKERRGKLLLAATVHLSRYTDAVNTDKMNLKDDNLNIIKQWREVQLHMKDGAEFRNRNTASCLSPVQGFVGFVIKHCRPNC